LELFELSFQPLGRLPIGQCVNKPIDLPADPLPFAACAAKKGARLCLKPVPPNFCAKTLNKTGSMSRLRSPSMTVASSASRRIVRRFAQTVSPLLRAVEQPKCASLILEKPPPQTPRHMSPENR